MKRLGWTRWTMATLVTFLLIFLGLKYVSTCNEALCASVVSKCMLTQSCKCELKNCTCCKDCFKCLDSLYADCCSCVEMCPKRNNSDGSLNKKSHVEDLDESIPELFAALTACSDSLDRWSAYTYSAHRGVSFFNEIKYATGTATRDENGKIVEEISDVNCTVAYMSQCMSWEKCRKSCNSMGAVSYRWFHDGCCECVGKHCLNYGIGESRCLQCPMERETPLKSLGDEDIVLLSKCLEESSKMNGVSSDGHFEDHSRVAAADFARSSDLSQ